MQEFFQVSAYIKFDIILFVKVSYMVKLRVSMGGNYQRVWIQRRMTNWGH